MIRPAEHAVFGEYVVISGRTCAYLLKHAGLDEFRTRKRGSDSEVDVELRSMTIAAKAWLSSATGTKRANPSELVAESEQAGTRLSTTQAGNLLGVSDRAIRKAIDEGRLPATRIGRQHRINRVDLEMYRNGRRAA